MSLDGGIAPYPRPFSDRHVRKQYYILVNKGILSNPDAVAKAYVVVELDGLVYVNASTTGGGLMRAVYQRPSENIFRAVQLRLRSIRIRLVLCNSASGKQCQAASSYQSAHVESPSADLAFTTPERERDQES